MRERRRRRGWIGRAAATVLAAGLGLCAVLLVRVATLPSLQPHVQPAQSLGIDAHAAAERLAGAVRIATISEGETAPVRAAEFAELRAYLESSFPRVHRVLQREIINGQSLLYTWTGRNPSAAPAVLIGHLDVVPVEPGTEGKWQHPPFSGAIAGGFIWGRGTLDDKFTVIGVLEAAERLLAENFQPERTVFFGFGHDEEIGGDQGAAQIAAELERRGVRAEFVLDEGGALMRDVVPGLRAPLACVGIAEKGSVGVRLEARAAGGHSSAPPRQTAIGKLAAAVAALERQPMPPRFSPPVRAMFRYVAPELSLFPYRLVMANLWLFEPFVIRALTAEPATNATVRTTNAATMVGGGVKENVLPASAWAVVNYRILPGDSVASVLEHVRKVVTDPEIEVQALRGSREPTVVSPTDTAAFGLLAKTIRSVFPEAVVAPYLTIGGTDVRHYQRVSRNLYRFMPLVGDRGDLARMHGSNERVSVEGFAKGVEFYARLLASL
ncbi:MAG: M20 family peptidase [Candidatus Binatia bacterium]|nr:M20 family peptidase [Candidatus Binatia bacterium]